MSRDRELAPYFEEAASWDLDRARQASRSARFGWSVAAIACLLLVLLTAALMLLMPLKRVEPFLIRVDRTTGIVDVVPTYTGHATLNEAITRYFLIHYVTVCERFNYATAESDYEECGAFQTPQENEAWYARWNPSNPASPLNAHKDGSTVTVSIEDVSFFKRASGIQNLAQVRYLTSLREGTGAAGAERHWIASIEYAYGAPSSNPKERLWNPLGFKVVSFTREPEVLSSAQAAATGSATKGGATP
ncbi:MAG TPA: type IV secretion system protein [Steroidobacteraceae bacterium]|nr:type IV secretion system protein [Steroidobacteraceae bacterium]